MKTFKDKSGREWTISVNVASVKRAISLVEIDILKAIEDQSFLDEDLKLANVLWALVQPQATTGVNPITDEQFGEQLGGGALEEGREALIAEIADFFSAARRKVFLEILAKRAEIQAKGLEMLALESKAMTQKIQSAKTPADLERLGEPSTAGPESSA